MSKITLFQFNYPLHHKWKIQNIQYFFHEEQQKDRAFSIEKIIRKRQLYTFSSFSFKYASIHRLTRFVPYESFTLYNSFLEPLFVLIWDSKVRR